MARWWALAQPAISAIEVIGWTFPPARLWVFSRQIRRVRA